MTPRTGETVGHAERRTPCNSALDLANAGSNRCAAARLDDNYDTNTTKCLYSTITNCGGC